MPNPSPKEITPDMLIGAALSGERFDLPVSYDHLADKQGRKDVIANRLAKNIGPLLGVPNPEGPFGEMSWICDFRRLTVAEIARGAPEPARAELKELRASGTAPPLSGWQRVGRAIYGKTPNTIVNASLNKFSPDTRSGAALTGLNRLLEPQTQTLVEAIESDTFQNLSVDQQLRAYGAMIFGVYRSQPLFFHAGLFARGTQRALQPKLTLHISPSLENMKFARCEIPAAAVSDPAAVEVFDLDIIDTTTKSLANVLIEPELQPGNRSLDYLAQHTVRTVQSWEYLGWREDYNPATEQCTIQSLADPVEESARFGAGVLPYIIRRNI